MRDLKEITVGLARAGTLAVGMVVACACSSDSTGPEEAEAQDDCQTVVLLTICGADTTRVDTAGPAGP